MKLFAVYILLLYCFAMQAYSQMEFINQLDSACGNDRPLLDSTIGPYPDIKYSATYGAMSYDRSYLAFHYERLVEPFMSGVIVVNTNTNNIIKYVPDLDMPRWHPCKNILLTNHYIINIEYDTLTALIMHDSYQITDWSRDGKYIYYSTTNGLYRSGNDGSGLIKVGPWTLPYGTININDSLFVYYDDRRDTVGYYIYNTNSGNYTYEIIKELREAYMSGRNAASENRDLYAFDYEYKHGNRFTGTSGLAIYNMINKTYSNILRGQRLANYYYPSWTANNTIIVSYVCRDDSTYELWEIDTTGKFIKKLFGKGDDNITLMAERSDVIEEKECVIRDVYPLPAKDYIILRISIYKSGSYRVHLRDLHGRDVPIRNTIDKANVGDYQYVYFVNGLSRGIYILEIENNYGKVIAKKIVIE